MDDHSPHQAEPPPSTTPTQDAVPIVIEEDLYCLECGYNLRGLSGDPARCPECGYSNDLGTARLPAELITKALRDMETAPTGCVATSLVACLFAVAAITMGFPDGASTLFMAIVCVPIWYGLSRRMANRFDQKPGWKGILFDFHLTTFLCLLVLPAGMLARTIDTLKPVRIPLILAVFAGTMIVGLRVYFAARLRIKEMQRDAAVRIAKETLERLLRKRPR